MKKFFIGISVIMMIIGIGMTYTNHPDHTVQLISCTGGVFLLAAGVLIAMVVTA